jgi:hypothetical protein
MLWNNIGVTARLFIEFEFNCMTAKWPAALTTLKLAGVETSPAALFSTALCNLLRPLRYNSANELIGPQYIPC